MPRLLRITTVPISLHLLIPGQMRYMREHGYEVLAVSADGPEVELVKLNEGVQHEVVPFTRVISLISDLVCLRMLIRIIRQFKPDVVHTHTPKAGLLGMMAAIWCGVPLRLHTVAGLPLMEYIGFKRWLLMLAERMTYRCATHIYPNSHNLAAYIQNQFPNYAHKLKVLGNGSSNGIDTDYFNRNEEVDKTAKIWSQKLRIQSSDFVWCFVGRLVGDKGIVELVETFSKLYQEYPDHHLVLVGPFEQERDALGKSLVDRIRNHPAIHTPGFQTDIRPFLAMSKVFVFPSYREGFPNVVLQAGAIGLPCIVSDINGCNEIIEHNTNGLVVPSKDADALLKAMTQYAEREDLIEQHGSMARSKIVSGYDREQIWKMLLEEYGQKR